MDQIYIGNFAKGLKTNPLPFNIDNDAFPTMMNFYSWRGRAKRKRGTYFLAQLQRQLQSVASPTTSYQKGPVTLVGGAFNLFSANITNITKTTNAVVTVGGSTFSVGQLVTISGVAGMTQINGGPYQILGTTPTTLIISVNSTLFSTYTSGGIATLAGEYPTITPGSVSFVLGANTYTEPTPPNGILVGNPTGSGTINYATGAINISGGGSSNLTGTFSYYPNLPVLGLEDFVSTASATQYPLLLAFDTTYSYQLNQTSATKNFYGVNYYKGTNNPFEWSGGDYQQFWTTNYSGALWATNNKVGLQLLNATYVSGSGSTSVTFNVQTIGVNFTNLVVGDMVWFNEFTTGPNGLNAITGTVSSVAGANSGNYVFTFPTAQTVSGNGIAIMLTNSLIGQDGIKWYDGDPTSGTGIPTAVGLGWANFSPPLSILPFSIDNTPAAVYYLVGALAILPFKDRILFFSPYIQQSNGSAPILLQDTVLWSWNGTPWYNSLRPTGETFDNRAYYVDQTGFGGYLPAGISQPIATISNNEDVLLIGFGGDGRKTRFVYTGNDLQPFLFFNINSEMPSSATFSAVALDRGVIDIGQYGFSMTDQQSCQRVDLDIPESVFQIQSLNNGVQRVNAIRDYFKEWIYFSYPVNNSPWKFPTQTFLFNYRDNTWGIFYENFTKHGNYRAQNKKTWKTTGFKTWEQWREPWNSGSGSSLFTEIIAGNPQGYVLVIGQGTGEGVSGTISAIVNNGGNTQITSVNHCVRTGDYLYIQSALGTTSINKVVGKVLMTIDANNFTIDLPFPAGTYGGLGVFTRLSLPLLQTKQFPFYWDQGKQVRLGPQKYLMDKTTNSQVTVNIYLSQDPYNAWNDPNLNGNPNSLIYSQIMYTCPESTNLGLTPSNVSLQTPTAKSQLQIWHRLNTSLIGASVQVGITLSDAQMRTYTTATDEITLHGIHLTLFPGPHLA